MLSFQLTKLIFACEHKKGNPIADHCGTSTEEQKHSMAYKWSGEKSRYSELPTSRTIVWQFYADLMAAGNNVIRHDESL